MSQLTITNDNLGPLILVIDLLCLGWIAIAILGRGAIKLRIVCKLSPDDILTICCLVISIGQSIAIAIAAINGLGKHQDSLSSQQLATIQKSVYAAQLLFLPNVACAKLAVLLTLKYLSPIELHRRIVLGLDILVVLWFISGEFLTAFKCKASRPWDWMQSSCLNQRAIEEYLAAVNLVTEIMLIVIPTIIIGGLQLHVSRKLKILMAFTCRILAVAAIVTQMVFLNARITTDQSHDLWVDILCLQAVQCAIIVSTCLIYLRPYLECLESGFFRIDDLRRNAQKGGKYEKYISKLTAVPSERTQDNKNSNMAPSHSAPSADIELDDRVGKSSVTGGQQLKPNQQDISLHSPQAILQTTSWTIERSILEH